jgi:hypothetical protein
MTMATSANKAKRTRTGRPNYTDMRPRELSPGVWAVVEVDYERAVISGFSSMADAWAWIDKHTDEGRRFRDTHNRIRMSFNKERFDSWLA